MAGDIHSTMMEKHLPDEVKKRFVASKDKAKKARAKVKAKNKKKTGDY